MAEGVPRPQSEPGCLEPLHLFHAQLEKFGDSREGQGQALQKLLPESTKSL